MNIQSFEAFQADALAAGADEALVRQWGPNTEAEPHAHGFDADAVVTEGEMWLTLGSSTRHLTVGDTFLITNGTLHSERYGPQGATYWVARRNAR